MMNKQYLKIADVFFKAVEPSDFSLNTPSVSVYMDDGVSPHKYATHAINCHDELVAEVERLREFERDAMRYRFLLDNCTTQQADSHGPIFVMTIRQKDNLFNVGLLIDEAMNRSRTDE